MEIQAGIVIGHTRVIYDGNKKEASVSIVNPKKSSVYLIQSWVDSGKTNEKSPFIVTPPLFRINPGDENILRIIYIGDKLPQDRESVFWLNIKSIPAIDDTTERVNQLQIVMKSRIKLFYRPKGLDEKLETPWSQLHFSHNGNRLLVINPTCYYITLFSLKVDGIDIKDVDMIPPKGQVSFILPSISASSITWQAINDYGGISKIEKINL